MSVGTAFHPRTAPLNRKMQWREWSGYYASSAYADFHDIEYNAIREAAAVIDVSPLYKYRISGPDAIRLADRVITRDATKLKVGQVYYTPWCDEHGKVIDDGTVHRVAEHELRWTAADPQYRWLTQNAAGLDVTIEDVTEQVAALALQGPLSRAVLEAATGEDFGDLRYFRRRASKLGRTAIDVSRTGYTGDLGYELWIPAEHAEAAWDAIFAAGAAYGIRPAGMLALDVTRLEAGLILLEVDYTSARHAMNPEQNYSPFEIGLGRLVSFDKAGLRRPSRAQGGAGGRRPGAAARRPDARLVRHRAAVRRSRACRRRSRPPPIARPCRYSRRRAARSARRPRTAGARSSSRPSPSPRSRRGSSVSAPGWRSSGRSRASAGKVNATVVELPFLDLERKRA